MQDLLRSRRGLVASAAVVILCIIAFFLFTSSNWRPFLASSPSPVASGPAASGSTSGMAKNQAAVSGSDVPPQTPVTSNTRQAASAGPSPGATVPDKGTSAPVPAGGPPPASAPAASVASSPPRTADASQGTGATTGPAPSASPGPLATPQGAGAASRTDAAASRQADAGATAAVASAAQPTVPAAPAAQAGGVPSFDILRVEPTGDSVIAARGAPNATIELLDNGSAIAHATADASGQVAFLPPALTPGEHNLVLSMKAPDGHATASSQSVAVSIPSQPKTAPMVALIQPNQPAAILSGPVAGGEGPGTPGTPAAGGTEAAKPARPSAPVAIRSVEVESKGSFYAAGHAPPGSKSRVYLNDAYVATVTAGPNGNWSLRINRGMTPGHYDVRADQVEPDGRVVARAQVPFEYPVQVASVAPGGDAAKKKSDTPSGSTSASAPADQGAAASAPQAGADGSAATSPARDTATRTPGASAGPPGTSASHAAGGTGAEPGAPDGTVASLGGTDRTGAAPQGAGAPTGQPGVPAATGQQLPPLSGKAGSSPAEVSPSANHTDATASGNGADRPVAGAGAGSAPDAVVATSQPATRDGNRSPDPQQPSPTPPSAADVAPPASTADTQTGAAALEGAAGKPQADEPARASRTTPSTSGQAQEASDDDNPTVVQELLTAKVVRGDSLWRISRHMLGHGIRYTQIYAANTQEIRDPRLIYPGQVFVLPQE